MVAWTANRLRELRRLVSNLFHSMIVDGKKEFLKKPCFLLKKDKLRDICCGIQWMSYGNQVEEVLKILILKCVIKQTKLCGPTSKLEGL